MRPIRLVATSIVFATLATAASAQPRAHEGPAWRETKCLRYEAAWNGALARLGRHGLGAAFLERHAAFLRSGCTGEHDVCPRSAAELNLANVMVVRAMNAGTASTFPPFACR